MRKKPVKLFDSEGEEVLITLTCPHCRISKPISAFGLRRMPEGVVRNQPWCTSCRAESAAEGRRS